VRTGRCYARAFPSGTREVHRRYTRGASGRRRPGTVQAGVAALQLARQAVRIIGRPGERLLCRRRSDLTQHQQPQAAGAGQQRRTAGQPHAGGSAGLVLPREATWPDGQQGQVNRCRRRRWRRARGGLMTAERGNGSREHKDAGECGGGEQVRRPTMLCSRSSHPRTLCAAHPRRGRFPSWGASGLPQAA
jgi:hypothetical protein